MFFFFHYRESSIWAPVNDSKHDNVYHYGDNGIKYAYLVIGFCSSLFPRLMDAITACRWVCGTASPCGEIVPNSGRVPEYFLLLEASNRCWSACICALTIYTSTHTHTHNIYMLTDNTIAKTARFSTFCDTNTATSIIPTHCRKVGEIDTYCDLTVQFLIRIHGMGMGSVTVVVTLLVGTTQLPENVCTYD